MWEQKLETLDKKLKYATEIKAEIIKEQEAWDRERREWWEKRYQDVEQRRQEEQTWLRKRGGQKTSCGMQ